MLGRVCAPRSSTMHAVLRSQARTSLLCRANSLSHSAKFLGARAMATDEGSLVKFSERNGVGEVLLNRPKKLNSLSLPMIHELAEIYGSLKDKKVRCVMLRGEGKALCAGGDVVEVQQSIINGGNIKEDFFYDEYALDYNIAMLHEQQQILQIAIWDGIVMGGGVGLSIHSPIRLATEKTTFAMPETAIGLFPDVGATWALSRLSAGEAVGIYLGLSGQRLKAADCLYAGLATHYCPSESLAEVTAKVESLGDGANNLAAVSAAIAEVTQGASPDTSKAMIEANRAVIDKCFGNVGTVDEIISNLDTDGSEFAQSTKALIMKMSPTSLKLSLEAILRHKQIDLKQTFVAEYRMSQWCMRPQPQSDFVEGIRAVLLDRDNKPIWNPASLNDVTAEHIQGFFEPLPKDHPRGELKI